MASLKRGFSISLLVSFFCRSFTILYRHCTNKIQRVECRRLALSMSAYYVGSFRLCSKSGDLLTLHGFLWFSSLCVGDF